MMREWPHTASNRYLLGCTSPPTSRFPSALEMSLGTFLGPREISWSSGMYNPIHSSSRQCRYHPIPKNYLKIKCFLWYFSLLAVDSKLVFAAWKFPQKIELNSVLYRINICQCHILKTKRGLAFAHCNQDLNTSYIVEHLSNKVGCFFAHSRDHQSFLLLIGGRTWWCVHFSSWQGTLLLVARNTFPCGKKNFSLWQKHFPLVADTFSCGKHFVFNLDCSELTDSILHP